MVRNFKSLTERTRARIETRKVEGEQGSLILDILIGMAIFALIAIIAVSAIGQYRERAYVQGATSDVNALGLALEAEFTDNDFAYPATVTNTAKVVSFGATASDVLLSQGNSVVGYDVAGDGEGFVVCVEHATGSGVAAAKNAWAVYDSTAGGLVGSGRGDGCDATKAAALIAEFDA